MLDFSNLSTFFFNQSNIINKNNNSLINHLNYNGEYLNNDSNKNYGGMIFNNGYYGKCIHPESYININYKTQKVGDFFEEYKDENVKIKDLYDSFRKEDCEFDGLGDWYDLKQSITIESYDEINNKICYKKIKKIYKQLIKEKIKVITLNNDYQIKITFNHKLYVFTGKKFTWTSDLKIGNIVNILDNKGCISSTMIKSIDYEEYNGFVYDFSIDQTKNYFANGILCHNTSKYIINNKINFDNTKNNQIGILCPTWRIEFWINNIPKNIKIIKISCNNDLRYFFSNSKKKSKFRNSKKNVNYIYILSLNIFEKEDYKKKIEKFINKNTFEQLIIDYDIKEYKKDKKKSITECLQNIKFNKYWLIINNYYDFLDDINSLKYIFNLYFLNKKENVNENKNHISNELIKNIAKIIVENTYTISKKKNNIILLKFNELENKNYKNYIEKFKEIYESNNISFDNDDYLKKYCCYAQNKIKINYFNHSNLNTNDNSLNNFDLDNLGNYKNQFIDSIDNILINNQKKCNICLSDINKENLGITNCGHIFCFSCIYKSVSYNNKCPDCRKEIKKDNIYLYDNLNDIDENKLCINTTLDEKNKYFKEKYCILLDELGTKISYLVNFIQENRDRKKFIFSNYKENIKNVSDILNQLKIKNNILDCKSKKLDLERKIYLTTYDYNFYKLDNNILDYDIIFIEPYYSNCKYDILNKYISILNTFQKNRTYHLIIDNSIEKNNFIKNKNLLESFNLNIF